MGLTEKEQVAVIGGSGFIGAELARTLINQGFQVTIFDLIPPPADIGKSCRFIQCDIREGKSLKGLFQEYRVIFLLATLLAQACRENGQAGWITNVAGAFNVFEEIVRAGTVPRVIFTSSGMVYAIPAEKYPTPEDSLLQGTEIYAYSKIAGEAMLAAAAQAGPFQALVLRFFTVYGPRGMSARRGHFIGHWLEQLQNNLPLLIHGSGEQTVDLTHVYDVVNACRLALDLELPPGECRIYNIGSGQETTVLQIAHWFQEVKSGTQIQFEPTCYVGSARRFGDNQKAAQDLSYQPNISPKIGIQSLFRPS